MQRERVNPSQKRKRKASHQFQESKAVHLLNGYTSSGCEEETPIKKESPYIHKDRMQDVVSIVFALTQGRGTKTMQIV